MILWVRQSIAITKYNIAERNEIAKMLTIDNPRYHQNEKMGFSNWNTPKELRLWREEKNALFVPAGVLSKLIKRFNPEIKDLRKIRFPVKYNSTIGLYDYQQQVVDEVIFKDSNGIIVMPAGSGKTQTALELIARLGVKTLWLTHTIDLLKQSYNRAKDNLKGADLGKIVAGKVEIGEDITFSTVQTLSKKDLEEYEDMFDLVIVDECHRLTGSITQVGMFYKVVNGLNARYKIGLTATPYRNMKGTEIAMFSVLGDILIEIDKSVVKTCKATVRKQNYNIKLPSYCYKDDGSIVFAKALNYLGHNKERNLYISDIIKDIPKDKSVLVLSDRLDQLEALKELVGQGAMIHGKMISKAQKQEREDIIQAMRDGKERILFASYGLAKEGLDIPRLEYLVLATPKKDKATVIQSVGRIERKFDGKTNPIVYDIVDSEKIFESMWFSRYRIYKSNGNL